MNLIGYSDDGNGAIGSEDTGWTIMSDTVDMSLDAGSIYLIKEGTPCLSQIFFKEVVSQGRPGLVLSRVHRECFDLPSGDRVCFHWLSDSGAERTLSPEFPNCWSKIVEMPDSACIYMDRLDYLIFKNGFDETLSFVQDLNDLAFLKQYTVILSLDPHTVQAKELTMMEKETRDVEINNENFLDGDLAQILKYLSENASTVRQLMFTDVQKGLGLSRPTVRKRFRALASMGLVTIERAGRSNNVSLTELGRSFARYFE